NATDIHLDAVLAQGCWTPTETFNASGDWRARSLARDDSELEIRRAGAVVGTLAWTLRGAHNRSNALAALAAAVHVGVAPGQGIAALSRFRGVKRRLELLGRPRDIAVYDDFAHHPT